MSLKNSGLRAQVSDQVVLGYQAVFAIPDRDYRIIYRELGTSEDKDPCLIGNVTTTVFLGIDNALFELQLGAGEAQLYFAGGVSYRFK